MGRITVFSADACGHSVRLKACLTEHGISEFQEINVTKFPEKRVDMMSLTNSVSTPQVFFNTRFIGGTEEVIAEMQRWRKEEKQYGSPYERFVKEVRSQPDPIDKRFAAPKPDLKRENSTHSSIFLDGEIDLPDGETATIVEATELLKSLLPIRENKKSSKVYKNSFSGREATDSFQTHFSIDVDAAIQFGEQLRKTGVVQHVSTEGKSFCDKENVYYRLYCHQNGAILNSYFTWPEGASCKDAIKLTKRLQTQVHKIEAELMNNEGKVNYLKAPSHYLYPEFEKAACELQCVDLARLNNQFRIVSPEALGQKSLSRLNSSSFRRPSVSMFITS